MLAHSRPPVTRKSALHESSQNPGAPSSREKAKDPLATQPDPTADRTKRGPARSFPGERAADASPFCRERHSVRFGNNARNAPRGRIATHGVPLVPRPHRTECFMRHDIARNASRAMAASRRALAAARSSHGMLDIFMHMSNKESLGQLRPHQAKTAYPQYKRGNRLGLANSFDFSRNPTILRP